MVENKSFYEEFTMKSIIACFTGHRPFGLPWGYDEPKESCLRFKKDLFVILRNEIKNGIETFLTGMAEGFDMIAAETIIELKKDFPNVKLIAVVPCKDQEKHWKPSQQERYWKIIGQCDEKTILAKHPSRRCFNERNLYMVKHSSVCIACWNGKPSGTGNTVKFAKENGLKVRVINPEDYR